MASEMVPERYAWENYMRFLYPDYKEDKRHNEYSRMRRRFEIYYEDGTVARRIKSREQFLAGLAAHDNEVARSYHQSRLQETMAQKIKTQEDFPAEPMAHYNKTARSRRRSRLQETMAQKIKTQEEFPAEPVAHYNKTARSRRRSRLQEAMAQKIKTQEEFPAEPVAHYNKTARSRRRSRLQEAMAQKIKSQQVFPAGPMAHYNKTARSRRRNYLQETEFQRIRSRKQILAGPEAHYNKVARSRRRSHLQETQRQCSNERALSPVLKSSKDSEDENVVQRISSQEQILMGPKAHYNKVARSRRRNRLQETQRQCSNERALSPVLKSSKDSEDENVSPVYHRPLPLYLDLDSLSPEERLVYVRRMSGLELLVTQCVDKYERAHPDLPPLKPPPPPPRQQSPSTERDTPVSTESEKPDPKPKKPKRWTIGKYEIIFTGFPCLKKKDKVKKDKVKKEKKKKGKNKKGEDKNGPENENQTPVVKFTSEDSDEDLVPSAFQTALKLAVSDKDLGLSALLQMQKQITEQIASQQQQVQQQQQQVQQQQQEAESAEPKKAKKGKLFRKSKKNKSSKKGNVSPQT